ncbi:hypothetical protein F383_16899 [Gossypium arboreum]|uniref:Uncharacterized protein n=1 Tax=Gossypium arboreum TaxID=29729 RepID=A0A0B0NHH9_GOSAR|nr:hypothetical protein F383_16899 [Gossypium arboreum]
MVNLILNEINMRYKNENFE